MEFTDERLTTHAQSVWLPMFVAFDHPVASGRMVFNGYSGLAALAANAPVIAQKSYDVTGHDYNCVVKISAGRLLCRLLGLPDPVTAEGVEQGDGTIDVPTLRDATREALLAVPHEDLVGALVACPMLGLVSEACYCHAEKTKDKIDPSDPQVRVSYFADAVSFTLPG